MLCCPCGRGRTRCEGACRRRLRRQCEPAGSAPLARPSLLEPGSRCLLGVPGAGGAVRGGGTAGAAGEERGRGAARGAALPVSVPVRSPAASERERRPGGLAALSARRAGEGPRRSAELDAGALGEGAAELPALSHRPAQRRGLQVCKYGSILQ